MSGRLRAVGLGIALVPACLVLHELLHLVVLGLLGGTGALVVRPWRFEFLPATLPSLHVSGGPALDPLRRVLFDLGGPLLATIPLLVAWRIARDRWTRAALAANVAVLCFFALVETADYLLDARLGRDLPLLTWEEFNYGLPLLMVPAAVLLAPLRGAPRSLPTPAR